MAAPVGCHLSLRNSLYWSVQDAHIHITTKKRVREDRGNAEFSYKRKGCAPDWGRLVMCLGSALTKGIKEDDRKLPIHRDERTHVASFVDKSIFVNIKFSGSQFSSVLGEDPLRDIFHSDWMERK